MFLQFTWSSCSADRMQAFVFAFSFSSFVAATPTNVGAMLTFGVQGRLGHGVRRNVLSGCRKQARHDGHCYKEEHRLNLDLLKFVILIPPTTNIPTRMC